MTQQSLVAAATGDASILEPRRVSAIPTTGPGAPCKWCREPIPEFGPSGRRTRADAETCSKRCRQADWRFGHPDAPPLVGPGSPRRFAYADPPYPGMSERYYSDHRDFAGEVDHKRLVEQLVDGWPDGWALSTSSKTLRYVLSLIPPEVEVRIGAWTKPAPPGYTVRGRASWEPVIFYGGRPRPPGSPLLVDWVHAAPMRTYPGAVVGTKPSKFCFWLFENLGAVAGDVLDDLYPGSGAVGRAWSRLTGATEQVAS